MKSDQSQKVQVKIKKGELRKRPNHWNREPDDITADLVPKERTDNIGEDPRSRLASRRYLPFYLMTIDAMGPLPIATSPS